MDIIILMEEIEETEKGVVEIEMIKKEVLKEEDSLYRVFREEYNHKIEKAIQGKDVTFSRFVIQACEYALNNIEDTKKDGKK